MKEAGSADLSSRPLATAWAGWLRLKSDLRAEYWVANVARPEIEVFPRPGADVEKCVFRYFPTRSHYATFITPLRRSYHA